MILGSKFIAVLVMALAIGAFLNADTFANPSPQGANLIFSVEQEDVIGAQISADESRVLSWSLNGSVRIWDVESGEGLVSVQHGGVRESAWNADESRFMTWGWDIYLKVWDAETGEELLSLEHDNKIGGAKWNADESFVLSWTDIGTVYVWDTNNSEKLLRLPHESIIGGAAWNQDESLLLSWTSTVGANMARVWDASSGEELVSLSHEELIHIEWNTDENLLLSWGWDHNARVWDAETGDLLFVLQHFTLNGAEWSPDESQILTWGEDNARIWNAIDGELLFELKYDNSDHGYVGGSWSPDGSQVMIWIDRMSAAVLVWDAGSGDRLLTLMSGDDYTTGTFGSSAEWNQEGSRILGFSYNRPAMIWDATDGTILATLEHDAQIGGTIWSNSEARVLSWSRDGAIKVWEIE